jgi:tetratricopeptide (TPR) repeat protein
MRRSKMKYVISIAIITISAVTTALGSAVKAASAATAAPAAVINVIEGMVYDPNHRPVPNVYVELQNEFNSTVRKERTGSSGRFSFVQVNAGQYYIKVWTTGTNFEEQIQSVEVVNVIRGASDTVYVDFYLKYDRRKTSVGISQITEALFVQEVPEEARKLYKDGVKELSDDFEKGAAQIDQALKIFPTYYDALNALGCGYVNRKEYEKSLPYLINAIDVNQRSFSSYYSLGYAAYQLKHVPEALKAARAATILAPGSVNAQLLYGTILRQNGDNEKALEVLLKANKLSKDLPLGEIHWQLALVYNQLKRYKDAADELESYLAIVPDVGNKKQVKELIQQMRAKSTDTK